MADRTLAPMIIYDCNCSGEISKWLVVMCALAVGRAAAPACPSQEERRTKGWEKGRGKGKEIGERRKKEEETERG